MSTVLCNVGHKFYFFTAYSGLTFAKLYAKVHYEMKDLIKPPIKAVNYDEVFFLCCIVEAHCSIISGTTFNFCTSQ